MIKENGPKGHHKPRDLIHFGPTHPSLRLDFHVMILKIGCPKVLKAHEQLVFNLIINIKDKLRHHFSSSFSPPLFLGSLSNFYVWVKVETKLFH